MDQLEIRVAKIEDAAELAADLDRADRRELLALGMSCHDAIERAIKTAENTMAFYDDQGLLCISGVGRENPLDDEPCIWFIATKRCLSRPMQVLRWSHIVLYRWLSEFGDLHNYVDVEHTAAIRWLKWLGAEFEPVAPYGPYRRPFHRFNFRSPT